MLTSYIRKGLISLAILMVCAVSSAMAQADYDTLYDSMVGRLDALDNALLAPNSCLGERSDGFLEINYTCSPDVKAMAESENADRKVLFELVAKDLETSPEAVGLLWVSKRENDYVPGLLREIQLPNGQKTWWNGYAPDPRENDIANILTLEGAVIYTDASASSGIARDGVQQYEAFGVVEKKKAADGTEWYKITQESVPQIKPKGWNPSILGWISENDVIPWRRALVMRFTNPNAREASLFFKNLASAQALAELSKSQRQQVVSQINNAFDAGETVSSRGVVAREPVVGAGQEQIVMYPVLDFASAQNEEVYVDGVFTQILNVAAQTRSTGKNQVQQKDLPLDLVFVMDATNSMKPFLESILKASEEFASNTENPHIRYGFIAYQDKHKDFSYTVKNFTPNLQPLSDFVVTLGKVKARETPLKGDDYPEAVFEALGTALESNMWREDAVKILVLVGDAPGREEVVTMQELRDKAHVQNIGIYALHINNPNVPNQYNLAAADQYTKLSSKFEGAYGTSQETPHFVAINGGSKEFGSTVLESFNRISDAQSVAQQGKIEGHEAEKGSLEDLIFQQATLLLADSSMPETAVNGWVCDKVLTNSSREALAPMILLTESELDELEQRVRELKDIGVAALRGEDTTTLDFFDLVATNTRFTIVNPGAANFKDAFSIPLGLDSLPYNSDIMATTRDEFRNTDRVQEFVRSMTSRLAHYEDLRRHQGNPNVWKKLNANAKERVVALELNQLP